MLAEVWIVKAVCVDPFDGTDTDAEGDHDPVALGICGDQFNAARFKVPANPPWLLAVTV